MGLEVSYGPNLNPTPNPNRKMGHPVGRIMGS